MLTLNMGDIFYPFNKDTIEAIIADNRIGNYALGYVSEDRFHVQYVGRSDTNLKERLLSHIDEEDYRYFKFSYADFPAQAYKKECKNYHDFRRGLKNKIHPDKPVGTNLKCPCCGK